MATAQLALRKNPLAQEWIARGEGGGVVVKASGVQLSNVWNGDNLENRHTTLDSADS